MSVPQEIMNTKMEADTGGSQHSDRSNNSPSLLVKPVVSLSELRDRSSKPKVELSQATSTGELAQTLKEAPQHWSRGMSSVDSEEFRAAGRVSYLRVPDSYSIALTLNVRCPTLTRE
jgi:hypothetical protein